MTIFSVVRNAERKEWRLKNEQTRQCELAEFSRALERTGGPTNRAPRRVPRCRAQRPRPANRRARGAISAQLT